MIQLFQHEELPSLLERQRTAYTKVTGGKDLPVVLFGAGDLGVKVLQRLRAAGKDADCFCDNDVKLHSGASVQGCQVLPVSAAANMLRMDAVFVVCIYNGSECYHQLRMLGCDNMVSAAVLLRHLGSPSVPMLSVDYATVLDEQRELVMRGGELWGDAKSRKNYQELLDWFSCSSSFVLEGHDPVEHCYFPPHLWEPARHEHVIDCGAFDGDSVVFLADKFGGRLRSLTAYEPDPWSFKKLLARVQAMPPSLRDKVLPVQAAVGENVQQLRFSAAGTVGSAVGQNDHDELVDAMCLTIDGKRPPPTYIKMDLEGYEQEALRGAAATLREHAPVLAVTTYHRMSDLWQVPLLIHSLQPDYKLYLRRYAEDCWESVVYAVPPDRVIV